VDCARVAEFLVLGISDHDEGTSYQEVRQLPAGHWLGVSASGVISEPRAYWTAPYVATNTDIETPVVLREQIDDAVRRQLRSDVPVGSCLSGGLDSGSIVATVGKLLGRHATQFTALTFANNEFDADESDLARSTADRAGVDWKKVQPKLGNVPIEIEQLIQTMDEPFPSLSMFAQRKVMQRARGLGIKVMLDGQGGDEVFLGYPRVAQRALGEQFRRGEIASALREWRALSRNGSQTMINSVLANIFFASPRIVLWRNKKRIAGLIENEFFEQTRLEIADQMYNSSQDTYRFQVGELTRFCLPQLLRFEDRNSMAYGVEARVPLLSIALVEMGLRLPLHWKIREGWTKYALRVAMKDRLPNEVVWCRRKRGFEIPQRSWVEALRPQIAGWMKDLPNNCPIRAPEILARIDAGQGGEHWLWRCLSVALWIRFSGVRV